MNFNELSVLLIGGMAVGGFLVGRMIGESRTEERIIKAEKNLYKLKQQENRIIGETLEDIKRCMVNSYFREDLATREKVNMLKLNKQYKEEIAAYKAKLDHLENHERLLYIQVAEANKIAKEMTDKYNKQLSINKQLRRRIRKDKENK